MSTLLRRLQKLPDMIEIGERLIEAGASDEFVRGLEERLASIPATLRDHDRTFGTDRANRDRRKALAAKFRKLAKVANQDVDAGRLSLTRLDDDPGRYRVEWTWCKFTNRPTIGRTLEEAAEAIEDVRSFGTVKLTRDVVLAVASLLDERFTIAETVTGKRPLKRRPIREIASIASVLLEKTITQDAVKKILDRHKYGQIIF